MAQYDTQYTTFPEPGPPANRWPLSRVFWIDLIIIIALVLVMSLVVGIYIGVRGVADGTLDPASPAAGLDQETINRLLGPGGLFAVLLAQNTILALVPMVRLRLLRRESLATIGFQAPRPLRLIAFGIGLGIVVLISNAALSYFFVSIGIQQNQAAQYPLFPGDYTGQALFFVGAALLAPIGEEILFRGYAFNAFLRGWGASRVGVAAAYLVSSFLFMIAHTLSATEGLIGLLVPTFVMGLILAWSMQRTRSLVPCMIAHGMNNGVALLALLTCINNPSMPGCPVL